MKTYFSLNRSNGVSKKPFIPTDLKNVHMTLVKVQKCKQPQNISENGFF